MTERGIEKNGASPEPQGEKPRIGVYICHCGGNISDVVDVEKVVEAASKLGHVKVARHNPSMCSDPGQKIVEEDIKKEGLDRVVIAACSPSLHELTFRQTVSRADMNPYLYEHANIREQVSWCSKSDPEGATEKAIRLVKAGLGKSEHLRPLKPLRVDAWKSVVIIGGGVSGLRSARDLSLAGLKVTLLERSPFLGGRMAQLYQVFPTGDHARELLKGLIADVADDPNITTHTLAEVVETSGYLGHFQLKARLHPRGVVEKLDREQIDAVLSVCPEEVDNDFDFGISKHKAIHRPYEGCYPAEPAIDWDACTVCGACPEALGGKGIDLEERAREIDLEAGAIIMATGFDLYEPRKGEFGYGEHDGVITLAQLNRLLDPEGPTGGKLTVNGKPVKNICLIHCVGSRQQEGIHEPGPDGKVNDYCSRVCCTATLQAALEIRDRFPETEVFEFYQDIRTYGRGHEDYYDDASTKGVLFLRYTADAPPVVEVAPSGNELELQVRVIDTLTFGEEIEVPADLVVLATGMMPRNITGLVEMLKLPRSADRFLQEVHPKLRPVELAINGILVAGTCQAPMDITESCAAASAAAAKVVALLTRGYIEMDPFIAEVEAQRCTGGEGCDAACVTECSFQKAITVEDCEQNGETVKRAVINAALCTGCGMCVAVCPFQAVQVEGWRLEQFDAMVDAIAAD